MATKTLRVTLADIVGVTGPTGAVTGEVWARYSSEVRYTDGTIVVLANRRVPLNSAGVADFTVVPNDDASVGATYQGFGIVVGWDLSYRGEHGQRVQLKETGRTIVVTSADSAVVAFGLKAPAVPVIPATSYIADSAVDAWVASKIALPASAIRVAGDLVYSKKGDLVYNVRDAAYGAVGTGLVNDKPAIQAAIDAANAAGGGIVYLPIGTYLVQSNLSMKSNVALVGAGFGSVIKGDMTAAAHVITSVSGASNLLVSCFAIDQSTGNSNNRCAVTLLQASNAAISSVLVKRAYFDAVQLVACNDVVVNNVIGQLCGRNGVAVDQTVAASARVEITNCVMNHDAASANLNAGYDVEAGQYVNISNCISNGFLYGATVLSESAGTWLSKWVGIRGLTVAGQANAAVLVTGDAGAVSDVSISGLIVANGSGREGVKIVGNVTGWAVTDFNLGGTSTASINGINVTSGTSGSPGLGRIGPGRVSGYTSHGVSSLAQVLVNGVVSSGNSGSGILFPSVTDCVVNGCILTGNGRYGVESTGTSDRITLGVNSVRGNTFGDHLLVGSANVFGLYGPKSGLTFPPTTIGYLVQPPAAQTLAANGTVTVDASKGDTIVTLQANATSSTIANPTTNQKLTLTWLQDGTGGRTYVWPTNCKFGGAAPADTTASKRSSATFIYDGTNWLEQARAVAVG